MRGVGGMLSIIVGGIILISVCEFVTRWIDKRNE